MFSRKERLERPPAIEDGVYWIGKFEIEVKRGGNMIYISPRQDFSHQHQEVDTMVLEHMGSNCCRLAIRAGKDSGEAESRILQLVRSKEWKARSFKYK